MTQAQGNIRPATLRELCRLATRIGNHQATLEIKKAKELEREIMAHYQTMRPTWTDNSPESQQLRAHHLDEIHRKVDLISQMVHALTAQYRSIL